MQFSFGCSDTEFSVSSGTCVTHSVIFQLRKLISPFSRSYQLQIASCQGVGHCAYFLISGWGFCLLEFLQALCTAVPVSMGSFVRHPWCVWKLWSLELSNTFVLTILPPPRLHKSLSLEWRGAREITHEGRFLQIFSLSTHGKVVEDHHYYMF